MPKLKIKIVTVGHLPFEFEKKSILSWKSNLFEIEPSIESYDLTINSDIEDWAFSDQNIERYVPNKADSDLLIAITNVPLELNWYTRRLSGDRILFTYYEIKEILDASNIPLQNILFRLFYSYYFIYHRHNQRIPGADENTSFTHDESRGRLFDMNGLKQNVVHSLHRPILCDNCVGNMRGQRISLEQIEMAQKEIRRIKKDRFYQLQDFVKRSPIWALLLSTAGAIVLSLFTSWLYDTLKKENIVSMLTWLADNL